MIRDYHLSKIISTIVIIQNILYDNRMKRNLFKILILFSTLSCFSQTESIKNQNTLTLEQAIDIALDNNYELKNQQLALDSARAMYRKAKGSLDIEGGAQAFYAKSQNPVDEDDPNYAVSTAAYCDNKISEQVGGSLFVKKLFGFGLETKLSYTVKSNKTTPEYYYNSGSEIDIDEDDFRNNGEIALEMSLPLFKSFKNSLTALQLEQAKACIDQMEYELSDKISQTLITVSSQYWNYLLMKINMDNLEKQQKKIQERNESMNSLIKAGVRSKNDVLAMNVNVNENRRNMQESKIKYSKAKMELAATLGLSDTSLIGEPENIFSDFDINTLEVPEKVTLDEDFYLKVEEKRPDLQSLKKQCDIALKSLQMAKADSLPDASLSFGVGTTGARYSDNLAEGAASGFKNVKGVNINGSLSVSAKLGNNTKKGTVDQSAIEYQQKVNNYTRAKNNLILQLQNSWEKLDLYRTLITDANEVLTLQDKLNLNEEKRFNAGMITVDDLLMQDQRFVSAEHTYYQTIIDYMQAILEFKYYSGELLK